MANTQKNGKALRRKLLRVSLIVIASVLLLCGSYLVTYALLSAETGNVTNTFKQTTVLADSLVIVEQIPTDGGSDGKGQKNGLLDEDPTGGDVTGATYLYAPGVTLKKRVYVKITNLKEDAYLYVIASNTGLWKTDGLSWTFDTNNWYKFTDDKNQVVYAHKTRFERGQSYNGSDYSMDVILNDEIKVSHEIYDISSPDNTKSSLTFSAYLVQAMGVSANGTTPAYVVAWNATN